MFDGIAATLVLLSPGICESGSAHHDNPVLATAFEIARASRLPLIPILTGGMQLSDVTRLSGPFADLLQDAPIELRHVKWDEDVRHIVERVEWQLSDPNTVPYWRTTFRTPGSHWWSRATTHVDQIRRRVIPRSKYWYRVSRSLCAVLVLLVASSGYTVYRLWDERYDRSVSRLTAQLSYAAASVASTTSAIDALQELAQRAQQSRVSNAVAAALKTFVLAGPRERNDARLVRRRALGALKIIRANDLRTEFSGEELIDSELFRGDLSSAKLEHVSFEGASLEGVRFTGADLTNASLSGAYVRNGDFSGATLLAADLSDLDWYNARGVTEGQLRSATRNGIRRCPADAQTKSHSSVAFRADVTKEYNREWQQFAESDRRQLEQLWNDYARPDGLCEHLDRW
jgi:uncharacterized protein YjbI with pentapeptide repeats